MASASYDRLAKRFTPPPPDIAKIYVYRNEPWGGTVKMDLYLDGVLAATTVPYSFTVLKVRPGTHTLVSRAEDDSVLSLDVTGGWIYFVWQEVTWGLLYARSNLQLVERDVGRAAVRRCNLIDFMPPPLPPVPRLPPSPPPAAIPPAVPPS